MSPLPRLVLLVLLLFPLAALAAAPADGDNENFPADFRQFDYQTTLRYSQAAIGRTVGDYRFTTTDGREVWLSDLLCDLLDGDQAP
jgi:hypothetical protein